MSQWRFTHAVDDVRSSALLVAPPFTEIVEVFAGNLDILCCHRQDCDDMAGFSRVAFNLRVPLPIFDLFFNSEHGYRGAYFDSPHAGLSANEACIQRLIPIVLAWAERHEPTFDQSFAQASLASPTAKVWLTEVESNLCEKCIGEWSNPKDGTPEIINDRWEHAGSANGRRGRKAPLLSTLRLFGAFLNERYDVFTPARKRFRAQELSACGWS